MQYAAYQLKWLNSRIATCFKASKNNNNESGGDDGVGLLTKLDLNSKDKYQFAKS